MSWDEEEEPESTTSPCPHCGADVYDDAERCPSCGMYLSVEDAPRPGWPAWMWIAMILALFVALACTGIFAVPALFR